MLEGFFIIGTDTLGEKFLVVSRVHCFTSRYTLWKTVAGI